MLDLAEELKAAAAEGMQLPSLCVDPGVHPGRDGQ